MSRLWWFPMLLALALAFLLPATLAAKREGVTVSGTPMPNKCARPEGKLQMRCPATHPFNYGTNDAFCCKYAMSANDAILDETCDGTKLNWKSHHNCCPMGLSFNCSDTEKGCHQNGFSQNFCQPMPVVTSEDSLNAVTVAKNILGNEACTYFGNAYNFWHASVSTANPHFTIDYGCPILVTGFEIRNENNYEYGNIATDTFKIEISEDDSAWMEVVSGSLADPAGYADCKRPLETFTPSSVPIKARYVRFTALTYLGVAASLKHFRVRHINEGAPRCRGEFKMVQKDQELDDFYAAENVLTDDGCAFSNYLIRSANYWLSSGLNNVGFTLDYGCSIYIMLFELRNSNNWPWFDRATNEFDVMVSDYLGGWTLAVSGSLPDTTTGRKNCGEVPLSKFAPDSGIIRARFIKFVAKSHFLSGPGLQYFNVVPFEKREGYKCNPQLAISEATVLSGHPITNMFIDECETATNMWLMPDGEIDRGFTLDYGCEMLLTKFDIKNARFPGYNNRGTGNFEIHVSKDGEKWMKVVSDTLPDVRTLPCDQFAKQPYFPSTGPVYTRHVRFRAKSYYGLGAGLQFFNAAFKGMEVSKAHCPSSVLIDPESDPYHSSAKPENVFFDACDDYTPSYNTWLPPNSATGDHSFILDYGCKILITKFQMKNARDHDGTRSTKDFTIDISFDKESWTQVVSNTLSDVRTSDCSAVPLIELTPSGGVAITRFVRFTVKNFYGTAGGGLRYFNVIHRDYEVYCPAIPKVDPDSDNPHYDINYLGGFTIDKIFIDECELQSGNYWLAQGYTNNVAAILDYGCVIEFDKVQIKNSINEPHYGLRSTADFSIEVSLDKKIWTEVLSYMFPDPVANGLATCATNPLLPYDLPGGTATAKFVRINLKTYHGDGSGLSYFNVMRTGVKLTLTPPSVCKVERSIHSQSVCWNNDYQSYGAHVILNNPTCNNELHGRWIPGIGDHAHGHFILDMGCEVFVKHYILVNDNDFGNQWGAVKEFTIEASQDLAQWVTSVSDQMPDPGDCSTSLQYTVVFAHVDHRFIKARYFRFKSQAPHNWYTVLNNLLPKYHMMPPPVNQD